MFMDANGGLWLTHPGVAVAFGVAVFLVFGWAHGLVSLDERVSRVASGTPVNPLGAQAAGAGAKPPVGLAGEPRSTHPGGRRGSATGWPVGPAGRRAAPAGEASATRRYGRARANSLVS